jgi:hypothetical protein
MSPSLRTVPALLLGLSMAWPLAARAQTVEFVFEGSPLLAQAPGRFDVLVDSTFDRAAVGLGGERLVKGAPYCADAIHETVQPLLDADGAAGNRIVRQHKTRLCRDGEGRTRQEVDRGGRQLVVLRDPVAREAWVLDSERKTARRTGLAGAGGASWSTNLLDSSAWYDYAERMREWARSVAERARGAKPGSGSASAPLAPPAAPAPPAPRAPAVAPPAPGEAELVVLARQAREVAEEAHHQAEVQVLRLNNLPPGAAPLPPPGPTPPAVSWTARQFAPRGEGVLSSLGSKEIDGLRVNGERTTCTIEAGKVGNEKPIQIVREVWTSPDLMLTVATRDFDPRRGETNYRLVNIKRGEPDAALMKVPADYAKPAARTAPPAPAPEGRG